MYLITFRGRTCGIYNGKWVDSEKDFSHFITEEYTGQNLNWLDQKMREMPLPGGSKFYDKLYRAFDLYNDIEPVEALVWNIAAACHFDIVIHTNRRTLVRG